jgi:CRP-like cAMP-binding protein
MHGAQKPKFSTLKAGDTLVRQGEPGSAGYLVLDGVIRVDHDGEQLAEYGPGAMLGERAHLEAGLRTWTLIAVTPCRVAAVPASQFGADALIELSGWHRREEAAQGSREEAAQGS